MKTLITTALLVLSSNAHGICKWDDFECSAQRDQRHQMQNEMELQQVRAEQYRYQIEDRMQDIQDNQERLQQNWDLAPVTHDPGFQNTQDVIDYFITGDRPDE